MKPVLKTFLLLGSYISFGLAVFSAFKGDVVGAVFNLFVATILDLQYKNVVVDERVTALEGKNGSESAKSS